MSRALAVVAACLLLSRTASADAIDQSVRELRSHSQKVRLAATLALSKSKDARAVLAVSGSLTHDGDSTIRRVSALALARMVNAATADDARELALDALERAARKDRDAKVRSTAADTLRSLSGLRRRRSSHAPPVFVNIDRTTDQSRKAPKDAPDRVLRIVRRGIESKTGYATSWPGGLPTSKELSQSRSQAYIVAANVKRIDITKGPRQTTIACTVAIRIAPWGGKDGGEKWEANKAASASGSAKAMTGNSARDVMSGMRDCLEAVAEDVTNRQVVPFLRRLAAAN